MKEPGEPANEAQRQGRLEAYQVLDTSPEVEFEEIVRIAAQVCQTPIALVSLVDRDRQWFKARLGIEATQTSRTISFCAHAVESGETLVVPNAEQDDRFADNPLVAGEPDIRFYAGAPLHTEDGALGTLCVIDRIPRELSAEQREALEILSRQVVRQLDLRSRLRQERSSHAALQHESRTLARELETLERLHGITSRRDLDFAQRVREMLELGLDVFELDLAIVSSIQGDDYTIVHSRAVGDAPPAGTRLRLGQTYCAHVVAADGPVSFHEAGRQIHDHPCYRELRLESYLGTPLFVGGERFGTLNFSAAQAKAAPFAERELALIRLFAAWVGNQLTEMQIAEMKDDFVNTVSHEFRTPLTSMRGSLGLLLGGVAGPLPEKATELLEVAARNTDRLTRLVSDMLDVAKIDAGHLELRRDPIDLREVLDESMRNNAAFAAQHGVELSFTPPAEACWVAGDRDRLLQVADNLFSNAAKYAAGSGEVVVTLAAGADVHRLCVADSGPGIAAEFLGRLFDKFSRAHDPSRPAVTGTGLGLAITKAIVEAHGGTIRVESRLDEGTRFVIELPVSG